MTTVSLDRLNLGMTPDPRDRATGVSRLLQNFDTTQKQKLTPYRDMVLDNTVDLEANMDIYRITRILKANSNFYGFGDVSAADTHAQVYVKVSPTNPISTWTTASSGSSIDGGTRNDAMFIHYKTTNKLYGGNNFGLWSYDLTSPTFLHNENTSIKAGPALVHSKDDCLYVLSIGSTAVIARNNAGSWNNAALTLPSDVTSGDICENGNNISIGVNRGSGNAVEYVWDRDASLTTLSESIDWGTGTLLFIENLGGVRVGVFVENSLVPKLILKYYTGTEVVVIAEYACSLATIPSWKQKYNNSLLFLAELTMNGVAYKGLWKLTKTSSGFTFALDRLPRNDTALGTGSLKGFYRTGDYVFISYLNPVDSKYTVWRTNDQASYAATSVTQTTINPGMPEADRTKMKKLIAVALSTEPLPANATATLKYRVDGGAWTTVLAETTDGNITTEMTMDASGTEFTDGREYEFAIESTGGAEITEVKYKYQIIPTLI